MRRKHLWLTLLLLSTLLLPGCALLPEEEAIRTAPVIRAYEPQEFHTTPVMRGDLIQSVKVSCRYMPVQTAALSFSLSDEYIDKVLVQAGAVVEKGQLLAQLQLGDLEERIAATNNAVAELELRHTYLQKRYDLALRRHEIASEDLLPEEKEKALEAIREEFALQGQELLDALELQRLTLKDLEDRLALRQIRAPFSGTVSRVSGYKKGDTSSLNSSVVTLIDSTMSLFRTETEYWDRFLPGQEYEITVSKQPYRAVVTDEASLGLEPTEKVPGKKAYVYLVLAEPSFELEDGDVGTTVLVLSEHLDVLYLPKDALSASAGQPIVYYQREDGMKAIKPVETGVTIGDYTEIISGLSEGELVIMEE